MTWWRKNWRWLLALAASGVLSILIILLIILKQKDALRSLQADLVMLRAKAKVDGLKADKAARAAELEKNTEQAKKIDNEIAELRRKALAKAHESEVIDGRKLGELSSVELALLFKKLGY